MEGLADNQRQVFGALHHKTVLNDGPRNADHIRFLKGILADQVALHLPRQHHHGNRIHVGGGNAGNGIGRTRTGSHQHDTGFAGRPRVTVRRMGGGLFMAHQHVRNLAVLEQGIVDV